MNPDRRAMVLPFLASRHLVWLCRVFVLAREALEDRVYGELDEIIAWRGCVGRHAAIERYRANRRLLRVCAHAGRLRRLRKHT